MRSSDKERKGVGWRKWRKEKGRGRKEQVKEVCEVAGMLMRLAPAVDSGFELGGAMLVLAAMRKLDDVEKSFKKRAREKI